MDQPLCSLRGASGKPLVRRTGYVALFTAILIGACYLLAADPIQVHAEGGIIETAQVALWVITLVGTFMSVVRPGHRDDRIMAFWVCLLVCGIIARELDLHEYLNEPTLGAYAVSFKLSWWLDGSVPLWIKAAWVAVALVGGSAFLLPLILVKTPTMPLLRAGDAPSWFFIGFVAVYTVGYLMDDAFGRGRFIGIETGQAIEEILELTGVMMMCASVWLSLRYPVTERVAALGLDE